MKRPKIKRKIWKYIVSVIFLISIIALTSFILYNISSNPNFSSQEKGRYSIIVIIVSIIIALVITIVGSYVYKYRKNILEELKILVLKLRVRKGDRKYRKEKFLLAYQIYQTTLNKCEKLRNSQNLIEKINRKEINTLQQLDSFISNQAFQTLGIITNLKKNEGYSLIVEECEGFFNFVEQYPKTKVLEKERDKIKKEYDNSLERLWERRYNETREDTINLIKKGYNKKAIHVGKDFLIAIESYSDVRSMRIFRDRILNIIENPIVQVTQENYNRVRKEVREFERRREFKNVYKTISTFLQETKEDKTIPEVERLRKKLLGIYNEMRELAPQILKKENYEMLVANAQQNYIAKNYKEAMKFTDRAIMLVKVHNLKKEKIALLNTSIHVTLVRFKFLCEEKRIAEKIFKIIAEAKELYKQGEVSKSKVKLQEALALHATFSRLYKKVEWKEYKELLDKIHQGLNRE